MASPSMPFDRAGFDVLDIGAFPVVRLNVDRRTTTGSGRWTAEMDAVIAHETPFVLIADGRTAKEDASEASERFAWYERRDKDLARLCRSMIYVEPDAAARVRLLAQTASLRAVFTFRFDIVGTQAEADRLARELLFPQGS